jgi:hypothetical protein
VASIPQAGLAAIPAGARRHVISEPPGASKAGAPA